MQQFWTVLDEKFLFCGSLDLLIWLSICGSIFQHLSAILKSFVASITISDLLIYLLKYWFTYLKFDFCWSADPIIDMLDMLILSLICCSDFWSVNLWLYLLICSSDFDLWIKFVSVYQFDRCVAICFIWVFVCYSDPMHSQCYLWLLAKLPSFPPFSSSQYLLWSRNIFAILPVNRYVV